MSFLTNQERLQLKQQHKKERDGRVRDRIKAILLSDAGWAPQQIAEVLLISDQAVRDHIDDYKTSNKLRPESGGSEEKFSKNQAARLEKHSGQKNICNCWNKVLTRIIFSSKENSN